MKGILGCCALGALALLAGCGSHQASKTPPAPQPPPVRLASGMRLSSNALKPNGAIPNAYTCGGRDRSLPVSWSGIPAGTKELVLVMRDPDAPGGDFIHWAVAGISPSSGGFPEGAVSGTVIPGRNSFGSLGYRGPCPPPGRPHHYVLTLNALPTPSGLRPGFSPDQLRAPVSAIATLTGTYTRG